MTNLPDLVIVIPVLVLVLTTVIQFAMWGMAAQAVQAAAASGGQAGRSYTGSAGDARNASQASVSGLGGNMVQNVTINVSDSGGNETVVVSGQVVAIVPFVHITVTGKSTAPIQQYRPTG